MTDLTDHSVEALEAAIRAIRQREVDAAQAKRDATPQRVQYVARPHDVRHFGEDIIWDPSIKGIRIEARCLNRDECAEAGWSERDIRSGGMTYLLNLANGQWVMTTGGGTTYITTREGFADPANVAEHGWTTLCEVATRVLTDPDSEHDITDLVERHEAFRRTARAR